MVVKRSKKTAVGYKPKPPAKKRATGEDVSKKPIAKRGKPAMAKRSPKSKSKSLSKRGKGKKSKGQSKGRKSKKQRKHRNRARNLQTAANHKRLLDPFNPKLGQGLDIDWTGLGLGGVDVNLGLDFAPSPECDDACVKKERLHSVAAQHLAEALRGVDLSQLEGEMIEFEGEMYTVVDDSPESFYDDDEDRR
jgi:hypothetical protein